MNDYMPIEMAIEHTLGVQYSREYNNYTRDLAKSYNRRRHLLKIKYNPEKFKKILTEQVFPELLEWCDRPEDERRRWHITNRYLEE